MQDYKMRAAKPSDINRLKELWMGCFGDPKEYTDYIFSELIKPEHAFVCGEDGKVDSMLFFEPFSLRYGQDSFSGAYIYGVATDAASRGAGLSTRLLEYAHTCLSESGFELSILVPANEGLFGFYGRRGYGAFSDICRVKIKGVDIHATPHKANLSLSRLEDLQDMREDFFGDCGGFVNWNREYLKYIGDECERFDGGVFQINCNGETGYAVCGRAGNMIYIKEIALIRDLLEPAINALHEHFGADEYVLSLRADYNPPFTHSVLPYSMIKWYYTNNTARSGGASYIAFTLD